MRNLNNIMIGCDDSKPVYRITRIDGSSTVNVDEISLEFNTATSLMNAIVENLERDLGVKASFSESPKNKILGRPAKVVATFGNYGIEVGISVLSPVHQVENIQRYASNISYRISDEKDKSENIVTKWIKTLSGK